MQKRWFQHDLDFSRGTNFRTGHYLIHYPIRISVQKHQWLYPFLCRRELLHFLRQRCRLHQHQQLVQCSALCRAQKIFRRLEGRDDEVNRQGDKMDMQGCGYRDIMG